MFFNSCNWCCRCRPGCNRQDKYCNKEENKNRCDINDKHECNKTDRLCCQVKCWRDNGDRYEDKGNEKKDCCGYKDIKQEECKREYNHIYDNRNCDDKDCKCGYDKKEDRKDDLNCDKRDKFEREENQYYCYKCEQCYTPNWDTDQYCNPNYKDNHKNDKYDDECCRPVKFICFPWCR
ncbi:MAG: hypothetical protein J6Q15_03335 [Clostridia bacterium]|nr:hypothetical protein [Clostridia bacterium]